MTSRDYGTVEIHAPEFGHEGSVDDPWARQMVLNNFIEFEFPLRSMLVDKFRNLIVAGRCASVTHNADKFVRNMGPIGQMGQAAGTFAALQAQQKLKGNDLIKAVKHRLEAAGLSTHK
jgi:hypothetical protein